MSGAFQFRLPSAVAPPPLAAFTHVNQLPVLTWGDGATIPTATPSIATPATPLMVSGAAGGAGTYATIADITGAGFFLGSQLTIGGVPGTQDHYFRLTLDGVERIIHTRPNGSGGARTTIGYVIADPTNANGLPATLTTTAGSYNAAFNVTVMTYNNPKLGGAVGPCRNWPGIRFEQTFKFECHASQASTCYLHRLLDT